MGQQSYKGALERVLTLPPCEDSAESTLYILGDASLR